tara:strand:+ start:175 stop:405 length:231 start_codon:yes stop_codon:yes gene_type:complete
MEISPVIFWNIVLTLIIAPAFWTFRGLMSEVKRIDILLNRTREDFTPRTELKDEIHILQESMHRIEDKLERLLDKK